MCYSLSFSFISVQNYCSTNCTLLCSFSLSTRNFGSHANFCIISLFSLQELLYFCRISFFWSSFSQLFINGITDPIPLYMNVLVTEPSVKNITVTSVLPTELYLFIWISGSHKTSYKKGQKSVAKNMAEFDQIYVILTS